MGAAFWLFALSSAVAQKPWRAAVCSVNIWKWLLGIRALRKCWGAEGRGLIVHRSKEGCCLSWPEIKRRLRRWKTRARSKTRWWPGLMKQEKNGGRWGWCWGEAWTPLTSPQCKQWPLPLLVNGTFSQCWQFGLTLICIDFKIIIELGKLRSSMGKRLLCGYIGTPCPRYLRMMPFLSLFFLSLYFPIWRMVIRVPSSCGLL